MRYVLVVLVLVTGCEKWEEQMRGDSPDEIRARHQNGPPALQKSAAEQAQTEAAAKAAAAAAADRSFISDACVYAEMFVHKALIQQRGDALPEHWKEKGEVIKREGNYAIVLVRTGIKEGMFSDLVVVQSYVMSIKIDDDGQHYSTTEALRCKEPSAAQIAVLMIKGKWPSAMAAMEAPAKRKRKAKTDE